MGQSNDQMSVEISNRPSENTKNENRLPTAVGMLISNAVLVKKFGDETCNI
jgi:hypothetical protein